jgi:hypothetical protein
MALDGLRARLDQMLADLARGTDARVSASGLYEALVETKAAFAGLKQSLAGTDRELGTERQHLADAERRGQMAAGIADRETADLAAIWVAKHRERVELLERKRLVQLDELAYVERQLGELTEAYKQARQGIPPGAGAAGAAPPVDAESYRVGQELDQQARDALVREQLAHLKKKLGRQD